MDNASLGQSPFAVLTFIVAPAVLTNATSVLAMSTINRMLRTRDRMHELLGESNAGAKSSEDAQRLLSQVGRVEQQSTLLLRALRALYVALGAFAAASLVTLLGAGLQNWVGGLWFRFLIGCALILGFIGVAGVIAGCAHLLKATQLSLDNIKEEAALIRRQQEEFKKKLADSGRS